MTDEAERAWEAAYEAARADIDPDPSAERVCRKFFHAGCRSATAAQSRAWSDEDVERAARTHFESFETGAVAPTKWGDWTPTHHALLLKAMRAALATLPAAPAEVGASEVERRQVWREVQLMAAAGLEHVEDETPAWSTFAAIHAFAVGQQLGERTEPMNQALNREEVGALFRRDDEDPAEYQRLVDLAKAENDALLLAERTAEVGALRAALERVLARDAEWAPSGMPNDCNCINLSRLGEREYEAGRCPHQLARAALEPKP